MGHSSPEVHAFFPKNLSVRRAIESAWADAPMAKPKLTSIEDRRVDAILRWFARDLQPSSTPTVIELLEESYDSYDLRTSDSQRLEKALNVYNDNMHTDHDLEWADETLFRELSFSQQRLVLFLRALVHSPDLIILDEALSGIDENVRDKALLFLSHGEKIVKVESVVAVPSVLQRLGKVTFDGLSAEQALLVISHSKEDVPGCVREWICLPEPGEGKAPRTGKLDGPLELDPNGWDQIWGKGSTK